MFVAVDLGDVYVDLLLEVGKFAAAVALVVSELLPKAVVLILETLDLLLEAVDLGDVHIDLLFVVANLGHVHVDLLLVIGDLVGAGSLVIS